MAEILVKAVSAAHSDPAKDRRGCYKAGMPVVVMGDGHGWGTEECLPKFVLIKIPGVSVATVLKYVQPQLEETPDDKGVYLPYRRRLWRIRVEDLPQGAKDKLATAGVLTIKAGSYSGSYDYTWAQVKGYFRNLKTGLDETDNL
jgi:hypothetical protein